MSSRPIRVLSLADLETGLPGLTPTQGKYVAEAAAVCLESEGHIQGINLRVEGITRTDFSVHWNIKIDEQVRRSWADEEEATEHGACGIAFVLLLELTEYTVVRRSFKSTGIDYWLGHRNDREPFKDVARLEVSGIRHAGSQLVRQRISRKKKQTNLSSGELPAYIVVVEFSQPIAHVVMA